MTGTVTAVMPSVIARMRTRREETVKPGTTGCNRTSRVKRAMSHWCHNWQAEAGGLLACVSLFLAVSKVMVTELGDGPYPRSSYPWLFIPALVFLALHVWGRLSGSRPHESPAD